MPFDLGQQEQHRTLEILVSFCRINIRVLSLGRSHRVDSGEMAVDAQVQLQQGEGVLRSIFTEFTATVQIL